MKTPQAIARPYFNKIVNAINTHVEWLSTHPPREIAEKADKLLTDEIEQLFIEAIEEDRKQRGGEIK